MIKKGIAISKLLKTIKNRKNTRKTEAAFEKARGYKKNKSVEPYNIIAGARDTKIIPVKRMSQKGSTFKTHKVRGTGGTGARGMGSRGLGSYSHESWRRDMDRFKPIPMSELLRGVFKKKK